MLAGTSACTSRLLADEADGVGPGGRAERPGGGGRVRAGWAALRCLPATTACRAAWPLVPTMSRMPPSPATASNAPPRAIHRNGGRSADASLTQPDAPAGEAGV